MAQSRALVAQQGDDRPVSRAEGTMSLRFGPSHGLNVRSAYATCRILEGSERFLALGAMHRRQAF